MHVKTSGMKSSMYLNTTLLIWKIDTWSCTNNISRSHGRFFDWSINNIVLAPFFGQVTWLLKCPSCLLIGWLALLMALVMYSHIYACLIMISDQFLGGIDLSTARHLDWPLSQWAYNSENMSTRVRRVDIKPVTCYRWEMAKGYFFLMIKITYLFIIFVEFVGIRIFRR